MLSILFFFAFPCPLCFIFGMLFSVLLLIFYIFSFVMFLFFVSSCSCSVPIVVFCFFTFPFLSSLVFWLEFLVIFFRCSSWLLLFGDLSILSSFRWYFFFLLYRILFHVFFLAFVVRILRC